MHVYHSITWSQLACLIIDSHIYSIQTHTRLIDQPLLVYSCVRG